MSQDNDNKIVFEQNVRQLYGLTGKLNLYVNSYSKEHTMDKNRVKSDIQNIEHMLAKIKDELDTI